MQAESKLTGPLRLLLFNAYIDALAMKVEGSQKEEHGARARQNKWELVLLLDDTKLRTDTKSSIQTFNRVLYMGRRASNSLEHKQYVLQQKEKSTATHKTSWTGSSCKRK